MVKNHPISNPNPKPRTKKRLPRQKRKKKVQNLTPKPEIKLNPFQNLTRNTIKFHPAVNLPEEFQIKPRNLTKSYKVNTCSMLSSTENQNQVQI